MSSAGHTCPLSSSDPTPLTDGPTDLIPSQGTSPSEGQLDSQARCSPVWVLTPTLSPREALLAEMGVAMREDGGTLGVFSPKKVGAGPFPGLPQRGQGWRTCSPRQLSAPGGGEAGSGDPATLTSSYSFPEWPLATPPPLLTVGCLCGLRTSERSLSCLRSGLGPLGWGETGFLKQGASTPSGACRAGLGDTSQEPAILLEVS